MSEAGSQENAKRPEGAYQASTDAEDGCVILPSIDLASVEAVAQVWGYRASILRLARRGSQVHLGVASSQEGRIGAQVQLEELPIGADSVVGPERRGLRRLRAALPPAEVVALREHFAKLIDPRGGHHFVGGQCPHQGFCNHRDKAVEPPPVSNSPDPNVFNQTSPPKGRGLGSPDPWAECDKWTHASAPARTYTHTHTWALWVCLPAFPHPRLAPSSPSRDPATQGPQQPPPSRIPLLSIAANSCPAGAHATLPQASPPRGPRRETCPPSARFLQSQSSRNPCGCLGLTDSGEPRAQAGQGPPAGWAAPQPPSAGPTRACAPPLCWRRPAVTLPCLGCKWTSQDLVMKSESW